MHYLVWMCFRGELHLAAAGATRRSGRECRNDQVIFLERTRRLYRAPVAVFDPIEDRRCLEWLLSLLTQILFPDDDLEKSYILEEGIEGANSQKQIVGDNVLVSYLDELSA